MLTTPLENDVKPISDLRRNGSYPYACVLTALVAVAYLAMIPYFTQLASQLPGARAGNPWGHAAGALLTIGISYVLIRIGLRLGRHVSLAWPPIDGWGQEGHSPYRIRRAIITATLLGAATGLFISIAVIAANGMVTMRDLRPPTMWAGALVSLGAGISEEVWYRLGIMTVFVWLLARWSPKAETRSAIVWCANVMASLCFGAAHLPGWSGAIVLTPSVVAFILAANGVVGLVCGWLYWRRGLIAAMIAHAVVDLVLKVVVPALIA